MSGKVKHPREQALGVARALTLSLKPLCAPERFIFAGSLRRMKPDIEVVYVPRIEPRPDQTDLLQPLIPTNLVDEKLAAWLVLVEITKRT